MSTESSIQSPVLLHIDSVTVLQETPGGGAPFARKRLLYVFGAQGGGRATPPAAI